MLLQRLLISLTGIVVANCLAVSQRSLQAGEDLTLEDIIKQVQQNEKLYEDIEVVVNMSYDIGNRIPDEPSEVVSAKDKSIFISQGERFWLEIHGQQFSPTESDSFETLWAFDGKQLRGYSSRNDVKHGKISDESEDHPGFIRPHTLVFANPDGRVPLSKYLADENGDNKKKVEVLGVETVAGLRCQKVSITTYLKPNIVSRHKVIWLAEERNFLPVKWQIIETRLTEKKASREGRVNKWREIQPGVWFPMDVERFVYQESPLANDGLQEIQSRYRHKIERVKLDPQYEADYFNDVRFPDGTLMKEFKEAKIVRRWTQGKED